MRNLALFALTAALLLLSFDACAEEGTKRYNFGTRPQPPVESEPLAEPAQEPKQEAEAKDDAPKVEEAAAQEAPAKEDAPVKAQPKPKSKVVNGVFSPSGDEELSLEKLAPTAKQSRLTKAQYKDRAERLVRFFIGSCFKFYGRTNEMVKFLDDSFPRLDTERKAIFAPVVNGTVTTQYWDVVLNGNYYMLAKDTSSGKCDVIAKDGASTAIHKELKAVMDGLTITKIVDAKTDYERLPTQNKEVSIVNVLGHPLEKELGMVATTQIKDSGDNMAAILTLFTVPQESVEIKEQN